MKTEIEWKPAEEFKSAKGSHLGSRHGLVREIYRENISNNWQNSTSCGECLDTIMENSYPEFIAEMPEGPQK